MAQTACGRRMIMDNEKTIMAEHEKEMNELTIKWLEEDLKRQEFSGREIKISLGTVKPQLGAAKKENDNG
jgi:pyruvate/2-oxoglutarate dehydrogenase complex dihydrolipoamide acyltransferase (E2) component